MNRKLPPDGEPVTGPDLLRVLGSASSDTDGPAAGAILAAAGDLLRRSQRLGAKRAEIDAALARIPRAAVGAWLASAEIGTAREGMREAVDLAVDAALAEDAAERSAHAAAALAALRARDRMESCLAGLARFEAAAGGLGDATWSRDRLGRELEELDQTARASVRALAALNGERRTERDRLDPDAQERAYWYGARSECDPLISLLSSHRPPPSPVPEHDRHLATCAACRADLSFTRIVDEPPGRHLSTEDLWNLEVATASPLEERRAKHHAAKCRECSAALAALEDGEQALHEAE